MSLPMANDSIWIIALIYDRKTGQKQIIEINCQSSKKVWGDGRLIKKD
jgi:hypothetical protein